VTTPTPTAANIVLDIAAGAFDLTPEQMLDKLAEKPIVGDVRGAGYFHSLELG